MLNRQKKVDAIKKNANDAAEMAMDFAQVILAIRLENMNESQSKTTRRFSLISFLIGAMGIGPLTDFIISFDVVPKAWKGAIVLFLTIFLTLIIVLFTKSEKS